MPVSGWWLPIVIVVAVMPGADAVSAVFPPFLPLLLVDVELQPAAARLRTASPATAAILAGCDLIMFFLSPCRQPPATAGATRSSSCRRAARTGQSAGRPRLGYRGGRAASR